MRSLDHQGVTLKSDVESTILLDPATTSGRRDAKIMSTRPLVGFLVSCAVVISVAMAVFGHSNTATPALSSTATLGSRSTSTARTGTFMHSKSCEWRLNRATQENLRCNPRGTDVVVVDALRAVYVDVTKAASESIRDRLEEAFGASWNDPKYADQSVYDVGPHGKMKTLRSTTASLPDEVLSDYTFFTFVRDPSERFASAYRQTFCRSMCQGCEAGKTPTRPPTIEQTIDLLEIMREKSANDKTFCLLKDGSTNEWNFLNNPWLDEHLQSTVFRMSGVTRHGKRIPMHFIGRVESLNEDWTHLLDELSVGAEHAARAPLAHIDHSCDLVERENQLKAQIEAFRTYTFSGKRAPQEGDLYEPVRVVYDGGGRAVEIPEPSTERGTYVDRFHTLYEDD